MLLVAAALGAAWYTQWLSGEASTILGALTARLAHSADASRRSVVALDRATEVLDAEAEALRKANRHLRKLQEAADASAAANDAWVTAATDEEKRLLGEALKHVKRPYGEPPSDG